MTFWLGSQAYEDHPVIVEILGYKSEYEMVLRGMGINPFQVTELEDDGQGMLLAIERSQAQNSLLNFVKAIFSESVIHIHDRVCTKNRCTVQNVETLERIKFISTEPLEFLGLSPENGSPGPLQRKMVAGTKRQALVRQIVAQSTLPKRVP